MTKSRCQIFFFFSHTPVWMCKSVFVYCLLNLSALSPFRLIHMLHRIGNFVVCSREEAVASCQRWLTFLETHTSYHPNSGLLLLCLCVVGGRFSPVSCFKVVEGGVASLSCQYSVKRYGLSRVCWGRGCGTFWCNNILVQTDEHGIVSKVS